MKQEAIEKAYPEKSYLIRGTDRDAEMIEKARKNATRAGVADTIRFYANDLIAGTYTPSEADRHLHIVTNPPYGKRL